MPAFVIWHRSTIGTANGSPALAAVSKNFNNKKGKNFFNKLFHLLYALSIFIDPLDFHSVFVAIWTEKNLKNTILNETNAEMLIPVPIERLASGRNLVDWKKNKLFFFFFAGNYKSQQRLLERWIFAKYFIFSI